MGKMKAIGCKFTNGNAQAPGFEKQYSYLTEDMSIKVDDYVVVIGGSGAPAVCIVTQDELFDSKATKMIVGKIDLTDYFENQKKIARRLAALKRLKEIDAEVAARTRYNHLASFSAEAAELLKELDLMTPSVHIEGTTGSAETVIPHGWVSTDNSGVNGDIHDVHNDDDDAQ